MGRRRIKFDLLIHDLKVPLAVIEAGITALMERVEKYGPLTEKQKKVLKRALPGKRCHGNWAVHQRHYQYEQIRPFPFD
jgi:hypothetical protein